MEAEAEAAWGEWEAGVAVSSANPSGGLNVQRHIKKRALKNKALSVGFNEKDLKDFVTGFHKRKKKRRKMAQRQIDEKDRRKRIEIRKQRKLERESALFAGCSPEGESEKNDSRFEDDDNELDKDDPENPRSVSGTKKYESCDLMVTVKTSEISQGEDEVNVREGSNYKQHQSHSQSQRLISKRGVLLPKKKPMKRSNNKKKKHGKSESRKKRGAKKGKKR